MNEEIPKFLTPEQLRQQEDEGRYLQWMKDHPSAVIAPENRRDCETEVFELGKLMDLFKSQYSIEELNSIMEPTREGDPRHQLRELAKEALKHLDAKFRLIKEETNISRERARGLETRWRELSNAVGLINSGKIRHG